LSSAPSSSSWWWLPAVAPLLPFLVALLGHVPLDHPDVVPLTGAWRATAATGAAVEAVTLPGRVPILAEPIVLARRFTLPRVVDDEYTLVFGALANGVASVRINGTWVGAEGEPAQHYKLEHIGLHAYPVPASVLRAGDNEVDVTVVTEGIWGHAPRMSVVDNRLLLGPQGVVRPWFDRGVIVARTIETGGPPLLAFLTLLVLGIAWTERDRGARALQLRIVGLALATLLYMAGVNGLVVSWGLSRAWMPKAITALGFFLPEVVERAFLPQGTRLVRVNRVVCIVHLVVQFVVSHPTVYVAFIPWLLVLISWGSAVSVRALRRRPAPELVLLAASVLAIAVAGVGDLFTDLNLVALPRLFPLATIDMAAIAAGFVVGRFVRTTRAHDALLARLEQKNAELTVALARAEESTRLKSAILANTSHELRTPLNSIINVPQALLEDFPSSPVIACAACGEVFAVPEGGWTAGEPCPSCATSGTLSLQERPVFAGDAVRARRLLHSVQHSGRHLLAVVSDVLDLSKLEAGQLRVDLADVPLAPLLAGVRLTLEPLAAARRITLAMTDVAPDVVVTTDATRLTQILINLAGNALKFSPDGDVVTVSVVVGADDLVFAVVDHGEGIDAADHARIFDGFVQVDDGHTRKHGGTGLGLAITRHLVTLLGGRVVVDSALGAGATFRVTLPRHPPSSSTSPSSTLPAGRATG
jgi:signal transduction histidine kinase